MPGARETFVCLFPAAGGDRWTLCGLTESPAADIERNMAGSFRLLRAVRNVLLPRLEFALSSCSSPNWRFRYAMLMRLSVKVTTHTTAPVAQLGSRPQIEIANSAFRLWDDVCMRAPRATPLTKDSRTDKFVACPNAHPWSGRIGQS